MQTTNVFDRNISENKDGKKNEGSYLCCVTNGEFYFSLQIVVHGKIKSHVKSLDGIVVLFVEEKSLQL